MTDFATHEDPDGEAAILAEAQRKAVESRARYGDAIRRDLGLDGPAPVRLASPAVVGAVLVPAEPGRRTGVDPSTGALELHRAGHPVRVAYVAPPPRVGDPAVIEARVRERIPAAFQGVTWRMLARLQNPESKPSLGTYHPPEGATLDGSAAARAIFVRMRRASKVVLVGESRAGKSLTAVAALDAELRRANDRALWVHAPDLADPAVRARALGASFVVLDDLGYELDGLTGSSLALARRPACGFLGKWALRKNVKLVTTTFLAFDAMIDSYGGGAAARVYEGAEVIQLSPRACS